MRKRKPGGDRITPRKALAQIGRIVAPLVRKWVNHPGPGGLFGPEVEALRAIDELRQRARWSTDEREREVLRVATNRETIIAGLERARSSIEQALREFGQEREG